MSDRSSPPSAARASGRPRPSGRSRALVLLLLAGLVAACGSTATPTPATPTPTLAPTQRPTPKPTPTPTPTQRPTPKPTPTPTPSPAPTATAAPASRLVTPCPGSMPAAHVVGSADAGQSDNWSGYVATGAGAGFTCVEARWIQPAARCRGVGDQAAAYWVGLGGYDQRALVQIGTESICSGGAPLAAAWHESLPKERYAIRTGLDIRVGHRIWAQVRWLGGSRYLLSLVDLTNGEHIAIKTTNSAVRRTSVEWIVEAPLGGCPSHCRVLPMPNFGTVKFTETWTTLDGVRRPLDGAGFVHTRETMVTHSRAVRSEVVATGADGRTFSVRWRRS